MVAAAPYRRQPHALEQQPVGLVRAALAGHPTPWIEVGTPLQVTEHIYRYGERGAAGQLFGIE